MIFVIKFFIIFFFIFSLFFAKNIFINPIELLLPKLKILNKILDFLKCFGQPKFFLNQDLYFYDIEISAETEKEKYIWYISENKNIGYFKVYGKASKALIMTNYKNENYFLNKIIFLNVEQYLQDKNETIKQFTIKKKFFNSLPISNEIYEEILFKYNSNESSGSL